jgi:hypothetical protein
MKLKLITEFDFTQGANMSNSKPLEPSNNKFGETRKIYFNDLPEMVRYVVEIEIGYDNIVEVKDWDGLFAVTDKDGKQIVYNPDGSHWD